MAQPLAGIKVLDLTRVLAGPVASRFLAGLGADVLRIDPPTWNEPGVVPEVTLGKRCARLDLHDQDRSSRVRLPAQGRRHSAPRLPRRRTGTAWVTVSPNVDDWRPA